MPEDGTKKPERDSGVGALVRTTMGGVGVEGESMEKRMRVICDYIAGMTDRYAIHEHKRLFDLSRDML